MNATYPRTNRLVLLLLSISMLVACSSPEETAQKHLQAGKTYMEKGDLDNALLEFKASNQDGKHAEAYYYMALLDERHDNLAAMRENLHSCLLVDEGMIPAKLKLAQLELGFGNTDEAMKQVNGVLIGHADNISAQLLKAEIYLKKAKYPDAAAMLDTVLNSHPDNVEALSAKAEYFLRQNELDQAQDMTDAALKINPDYKRAYQLRVNIHARRRNIEAMIGDFRELIRLDPGNENYKLRLAPLYAVNNKLPEAEALLRDMISQNPGRVENKLLLLQFLESHAPERVATEYEQWLNSSPLLPESSRTGQLLELSRWMMANDRPDLAATGLKQIVDKEKNPQLNLTAQTDLAEIALIKNQYQEAEAAADAILKQNSDFIQASFLKARIYLSRHRTDDAIKLLNGLTWAKNESGDLYTYLGMAYLQKNDQQQADKNFKLALEQNPANRTAFFPVYNSYLQANQPENAKQMLDKALKYKPHQDWLLIAKAEMEIQEKNWDEARNTVQLLTMFSKNTAATAYLRANILQGAGQFPAAIVAYQKLLELAPDNINALLNLARSYEAIKSRDKAIAFLEALNEKHPDNFAIVSVLGNLYSVSKEPDKAEKLYTEQVQRTPKIAELYINLARLFGSEHKKPEEAKEILLNGLKNNPDDLKLSLALAGWYDENGDTNGARPLYEKLWEKYPDSNVISNNLANILLNSKSDTDIARGIALAQRFKESENPDYQDTYAWSLVKSEQGAKAVPLLKALITKLPELADIHHHLGVAYLISGQRNLALTEFKQALALSDKHKHNFPGKTKAINLVQELGATNKN
ncbi:MAG: tetratricopeptide repeat protein [Methylococcales bacterium]|nr:tetratricopeptide repeat protein [Methylococcales bacterium]